MADILHSHDTHTTENSPAPDSNGAELENPALRHSNLREVGLLTEGAGFPVRELRRESVRNRTSFYAPASGVTWRHSREHCWSKRSQTCLG